MEFGNSEQNFGMIASKFTVAMCYTHPDGQTSNTSTRLWFYYIITKIHPPFQNPGSAPDYWPNGPRRETLKFNLFECLHLCGSPRGILFYLVYR